MRKILKIKKNEGIYKKSRLTIDEEEKSMSRERKIEEAVEQTLQSFEPADRLQPSPFFYTRLRARIDGLHRGATQRYRFAFCVLRFVSLSLLLIWNIVTVTYLIGSDQTEAYNRSEMISAFAELYVLEREE